MFKKILLAIVSLLYVNTAIAQTNDKTLLLVKPVHCVDGETSRGILLDFYDLGMRPILGFVGNSFTKEGFQFASTYYIMYSVNEDKVVIIEKGSNNNMCIITGASKSWLTFDGEVLEELLLDIFREKL